MKNRIFERQVHQFYNNYPVSRLWDQKLDTLLAIHKDGRNSYMEKELSEIEHGIVDYYKLLLKEKENLRERGCLIDYKDHRYSKGIDNHWKALLVLVDYYTTFPKELEDNSEKDRIEYEIHRALQKVVRCGIRINDYDWQNQLELQILDLDNCSDTFGSEFRSLKIRVVVDDNGDLVFTSLKLIGYFFISFGVFDD
jgi:hypothetical protein